MPRYSSEQWASWVEQQQESGLSVVDFCDEIGVSTNSFYRWRSRLRAEARDVDSPGPMPFVPVSVVGVARVEIDLPCGAIVRVPPDDGAVRCVLQILLEAGSDSTNIGGAAC